MTSAPTEVALPTGTVTLLFTDVEGSTRLLARLGERYADVVSAQRRVVRAAVRRWGGHELGTEGDSFFVVFPSARDALCAARDAQLELAGTAWPDGATVRVRMGLHTGEPTRHEDGYVGMDVHRAARVAGSAHGGQVVLTAATHAVVAADPVPGARVRDLGRHRLKDLPEPVHLFQLCVDSLPATFPRLKSLGSPSTLPTPATALVGRSAELAVLDGLLTDPRERLVTLTGPAGTGKTRLALAAAERADTHHADGVYFVPLAQARTADVMWTALADALAVPDESRPAPALLEHLSGCTVLLVLDNLEQLPEAPWVVRALVDAGPGVRVLATSRSPLHLTGERELPVPPLPVVAPAGDDDAAPQEADAVRLFVERARLVRPDFALTDANRADVAELCRLLDGLPLAVELVAARSRLLGPGALRAQLDRSLDPPGPGAAVDAPGRQRTLRAALDWSHDLLEPGLARAFRRLGVCEGAVTLPAVAAVVGEEDDALDVVGRLVDVSLLAVDDEPDGEPRVRMLQTVRRYARERLAASGELQGTRRRHAEHYVEVAEQAAAGLRGPQHLAARDRIEQALPDLRAALGWTLDGHDDADEDRLALGLRLVQHLAWFWYGCGYPAEGRRWLQTAVDAAGTRRSPAVLTALHGLGVLVLQQGRAERAREILTVCLEQARASGDPALVSRELNSLAVVHRDLGDPGTATALAEEAVASAREARDLRCEVNAVSNLALLAADGGRHEESITLLRRCLELDTRLGDAWGQGADHVNLVGSLLRAGRTAEAQEHLLRHAADAVALNDSEITVDVLTLFAVVHARRGDAALAARLLGAATRLRELAELPMTPVDTAWVEEAVGPTRDAAPSGAWHRDLEVGRGWDVGTALASATTG